MYQFNISNKEEINVQSRISYARKIAIGSHDNITNGKYKYYDPKYSHYQGCWQCIRYLQYYHICICEKFDSQHLINCQSYPIKRKIKLEDMYDTKNVNGIYICWSCIKHRNTFVKCDNCIKEINLYDRNHHWTNLGKAICKHCHYKTVFCTPDSE